MTSSIIRCSAGGMPRNMDPSTSDNISHHHVSMLSGYCARGSASLGYLLDDQHPLVANAFYSADGHSMHHGNDICARSLATNTDQTIHGAALSKQCNICSMPGCVGCLSGGFTDAASSFSLTRNLNVHRLGTQSDLRMELVDASSLSAENDQSLQYALQHQQRELFSQQQSILGGNSMSDFNWSQSNLMGSYGVTGHVAQNQICNQPDLLHLQQNGQSFQQQNPECAPHQMVLEDHSRVNSYFIPDQNQVPKKSGPMHNVTKQFNPPIQRCERIQNTGSEHSATVGRVGLLRGEVQHVRCRMFFLTYQHARYCTYERKCEYPCCPEMKLLIHHISHCSDNHCKLKGCFYSKKLLSHYQRCLVNTCGICGPTKLRPGNHLQATFSADITEPIASFPTTINNTVQVQPSSNCTERGNPNETSLAPLHAKNMLQSFPERASNIGLEEIFNSNITEPIESFSFTINTTVHEQPPTEPIKSDNPILLPVNQIETSKESVSTKDSVPSLPEGNTMEADNVRLEGNCTDASALDAQLMKTKLPNQKKGMSLIESFSPKQIKEHLESLRQPIGQNKVKETEYQESGDVMDVKNCSLCGMKDLYFDPPPRYCAACDIKISPKKACYFMRSNANDSDSQTFICSVCINSSGETIKIHGTSILKATLERRKNYTETFDLRELWFQCHKCEAWQHQICTLFNSMKDKTMKAYHTCPNCILQEIESGEHKPLLQSKIPGAKDLPTTILSDRIEKRVFRRLEEERHERANSLGKNISEVPTAEGLVVRVVSSVVKQLEVKPIFRDIFQEEAYPSQFPYKSKAVLLFQNIDGADVCLFAMYVQEYGSECADPNRSRVCISYIDSVRYFRPEVKTVTGEALRTFVYHEILEGYFEYCKKRGFTSSYIWACPPFKGGDDYILYCHPKTQKFPKDGKLREWYQKLIRKAEKEKIVAEHNNLYDYFFVKIGECKAKVTAARLPYFEGDYWPGVAEQFLQSEDGHKSHREGTKADDRALRASRRDGLVENTKDILLMHQLGSNIFPMKENFIMVQLWHNCKHCCQSILSGKQLVCNDCKNFRLCEKCFMIQKSLHVEDRHPIHTSKKHSFHEVPVDEETMQSDQVPVDDHSGDIIGDDEEVIRSEIFDSRLIFLDHCQKNYLQFDTLRRAKHSTMMILYNLHNQIPPPGLREDDSVRRCVETDRNSQQNNQIMQARSLEELPAASLLHARCIPRTHSQSCLQSDCRVPRCRYSKELWKKNQSVADPQPSCLKKRGKEAMRERIRKRQKSNALQT